MDKQSVGLKELVVFSGTLSFFLGVFVPLNAYVNNAQEFPLIRPLLLLIASLTVFVGLWGVSLLCFSLLRKCVPAVVFVESFLLGVILALYVQGNLINLNYGVLDGHEINWSKMFVAGIINATVWCLIVLFPVVWALKSWKRMLPYLYWITLIFGMFIALVTCLQFGSLDFTSTYPVKFTERGFMDFSRRHNVVVCIVDSLEQRLFEQVIEQHPEIKNLFGDFTYYQNTIGRYPTTKGALPHILTGVLNDNSLPFVKYKEHAYLHSKIYSEILKVGGRVDLYTESVFAPNKGCADQLGCIDNAAWSAPTCLDVISYYITTLNSAVFTYLPHFLKRYHERLQLPQYGKSEERSGCQELTGKMIEDDFFRECEFGFRSMSARVDGLRVKFYHTEGVHAPHTTLEKAEKCLSAIGRFYGQLKGLGRGKLDLIVMADHGCGMRERPVFLCNNSKCGFQIDATPFSYDDFDDLLVGAIRDGVIRVSESGDVREFSYYNWDNSWSADYLPRITIRRYDKRGVRFDDLTIAKNQYEKADLADLVVSHISVDGTLPDVWMWTLGTNSWVRLPVPATCRNKKIRVELDTQALLNATKTIQRLRCGVNGGCLQQFEYASPGRESQVIVLHVLPQDVKDGVVEIALHVESPITPEFWMPPDPNSRPLGVRIDAFRLMPEDE